MFCVLSFALSCTNPSVTCRNTSSRLLRCAVHSATAKSLRMSIARSSAALWYARKLKCTRSPSHNKLDTSGRSFSTVDACSARSRILRVSSLVATCCCSISSPYRCEQLALLDDPNRITHLGQFGKNMAADQDCLSLIGQMRIIRLRSIRARGSKPAAGSSRTRTAGS